MMDFESINYVKFEGELLRGTIGKDGREYVFTQIGNTKTSVELSYSDIKAAVAVLGNRRMQQLTGATMLSLGQTSITLETEAEADKLERELNTLLSAWHQKK